MNGIDTEEWNPCTDPHLSPPHRYTPSTMVDRKTAIKTGLQRRLGLQVNERAPLVVFIGRLTEQKGVDVVLNALPTVLTASLPPSPYQDVVLNGSDSGSDTGGDKTASKKKKNPKKKGALQIAMLGTGDAWMQSAMDNMHRSFPGQAIGITKFSEELAHLLVAAADYILVPSRFEPCGLVAQCGARYGAVPIVTGVGGLKDLVEQGVTGYVLPPLHPAGETLPRAADVRTMVEMLRRVEREAGGKKHRAMQKRCMEMELSWETPATAWEAVLREVVARKDNTNHSSIKE